MKPNGRTRACVIAGVALLVPLAQAQSTVRVRGTITAVSADVLPVSQDGVRPPQ